MKFVITDGQGNYIRLDSFSGKYVSIKSKQHACIWDNAQKANSVLNNSISKNLRGKFAVHLIEDKPTIEKSSGEISNMILNDIKNENENISEYILKINQIADLLSNIDIRMGELGEILSTIDKTVVDIEHYIEFGKFNAYQGWLCFKMLQNSLKKRRQCKNEIEAIKLIKQCNFDNSTLKNLLTSILNINNKQYTPRVLSELFGEKHAE